MDSSAYGVFDRETFGQPIPVDENAKYASDGNDKWYPDDSTGMPAKRSKDGSTEANVVEAETVVLTGLIEDFKNSTKYLVYEVSPDGTNFSRHYHFIGFDENGVYETRSIHLAEGWVTRLSMCENIDADNEPVGQSYTITFDDTDNSDTAKVISIMSYNKGYAEEAGKDSDPDKVIDLDFAMTNRATTDVIAWYSSNNDSGILSFDTWFGYGPEMIIGYGDWPEGFTPYAEPYSIGSDWNPGSAEIEVHISIITEEGSKDFKTTFNDNGESYSPGSFGLDMSAVSR